MTALGASFLCLFHCLMLPLVVAALPLLAQGFNLPESVHQWLLAFVVPTTGPALLAGRAKHRLLRPLLAGGAGVMLLAVGAFLLSEGYWETPVTVAGSLTIALAHADNWRLRHRFSECGQGCGN